MSEGVDIVQASNRYCGGGYWSGTESRHRKRYIAMVPVSRYVDGEKLLPKGVMGAMNPALLKMQPPPPFRKENKKSTGHNARRLVPAWRDFFFVPGTKPKPLERHQGLSLLARLAVR